eukprot:scaffold249323_cov36-Cyclotella_meneghiniana.AAC.3
MWNREHFPWSTRLEILRAKRNKHSVDVSAAEALVGNNENTPAEERVHAANENAVEEADNGEATRQENYEDIEVELFRNMDTRVLAGYDWSADFDEQLVKALPDFIKAFYEAQMAFFQNQAANKIELINEELYRPEFNV